MKITFETAAFADSIKKADILAPTKGAALDKAGGILLEVDPSGASGWTCLVRTTNLDIFRIEWVDPLSIEDDGRGPRRWLLPSRTFTPAITTLPIGTGHEVTLEDTDDQRSVRVRSGRRNVRFNLMDSTYYPEWEIFDTSQMVEAKDLGARINQVDWASADSGEPLNGVHFTGEHVVATNRFKIALAPVTIPGVTDPFTIPPGPLASLLSQTGEIKVGLSVGPFGNQFLLMPNEQTQIRCVTYGNEYPGYSRACVYDKPNIIKLKKTALLGIIEPAAAYVTSDRDAGIQLHIGQEEIACVSVNSEVGVFGDVIEVPGYADHPRVKINFDPRYISNALSKSSNDEVILGYDITALKRPLFVDGGSGYYAWVAPRGDAKPTQNPEGS